MYFTAGRTILFREEHSRRVLVPKVDFISAPGWSPPEVERRGGPQALLTGKALFSWQPDRRRFRLESVHPGASAEELLRRTEQLQHHEKETVEACRSLRSDLSGTGGELLSSVLDIMAMDSEKHHRLLTTVQKMIRG
jgi:hypothetical protein